LRIHRHATKRPLRQIVAFAGQTIPRVADALFDTPRSTRRRNGLSLVAAHHHMLQKKDGPPNLAERPAPKTHSLDGSVLAALAAGFRGTFAILREVARIVLGTAATMTVLSALAAGFRGALAVVGKIA
jgi:hypothetical protein